MENGLVGLNAVLPQEFVIGQNTLVVVGWRMSIERGAKRYALLLIDGRETKTMSANELLQKLSDKELEHKDNLLKPYEGEQRYKVPFVVNFKYTGKSVSQFRTCYLDINIKLRETGVSAPNPPTGQKTFSG